LLALRSGGTTEILPAGNQSVLAYRRAHPRSAPFLSLTNFSDVSQSVDAGLIARAGLREPRLAHASTAAATRAPRTGLTGIEPAQVELAQVELAQVELGQIRLAPWSFAWVAGS
jgi:hypothetical protein